MPQTIDQGTRVTVNLGPVNRTIGPVVRGYLVTGTVLRQNTYESTHYPVRLDSGQVIIANDSVMTPVPA